MKKNILVLAFLTLFISSCKDEESKIVDDKETLSENAINPNTLKVELDITLEKDDELILFWKDASISYFDAENTIYAGIKGNANSQKVVFEFEEGIIPNDIRIDVSSKKEQLPIKLNSIKISQQDRVFMADKNNFEKYFKANDFVKFDSETGIISFEDKGDMHDPFFTTNVIFGPEFEKVQNTIF